MEYTFVNLDEDATIRAIQAAQRRVVYIAPGIAETVARALGERAVSHSALSVLVILDVDPEVCRLGYGSMAGLQAVVAHARSPRFQVRFEAGLRIGLLAVDDTVLLYAPTPLLIEAGSWRTERRNAILLGEDNPSVFPNQARIDLAAQADTLSQIGANPVTPVLVDAVRRDLASNPPRAFDVTQAERVFNSRIQYVEFSLLEYRLSARVVHIPPELMGLADDRLRDRWRLAFRLYGQPGDLRVRVPVRDEAGAVVRDEDGTERLIEYDEQALNAEKQEIVAKYLRILGQYGTVIRRTDRREFQARVRAFTQRVRDYAEGVRREMQDQLKKTVSALVDELLPAVRANPPRRYRAGLFGGQLADDELKTLLRQQIGASIPPSDITCEPKVKLLFKDVSYETIHDPGFLAAVEREYGPEILEGLFTEYHAAPNRTLPMLDGTQG